MTKVDFDQICDTLSQQVDAAQYERLRWERTEGPMLASLVVLAHSALEERGEFELTKRVQPERSGASYLRFTAIAL